MNHYGADFLTNRRGSLQAGYRSVSEGGKKADRTRHTTREGSSASLISLDVRCGCQYFQCDSPLPEKSLLAKAARPSSRLSQNDSLNTTHSLSTSWNKPVSNHHVHWDTEQNFVGNAKLMVNNIRDHEYEPINPPLEEKKEIAPPKSHVSEVLNPSSNIARLPPDDVELDLSLQEMPTDIEDRFFNNKNLTTTSITTTTNTTVDKRASPSRTSPSKRSSRSRSKEKEPTKPNKFQTAIKESATKFKTKLQSIKKPNISLPPRPKFHKPNIKRPNINLPKLPDLSTTFRRKPKTTEKTVTITETVKVEDSGSKGIFDFSTYPRFFKKRKHEYDSGSLKGHKETKQSEKEDVASKPNRRKEHSVTPSSIRIPLHSEDSMDQEHGTYPEVAEIAEEKYEIEEDVSPRRYQEDIDADDEELRHRERQEKHRMALAAASQPEENRWNKGNFYEIQNGKSYDIDQEEEEPEEEEGPEEEEEGPEEEEEPEEEDEELELYRKKQHEIITDLDQPEEETPPPPVPTRQRGKLQQNDSLDTNQSKVGSSISSLGLHRRGVIEEIDSDQFFLREKGISQDNIDMGKYLSTEIREAFRIPTSALSDMHSYSYEEIRTSNQSLPETKRKQMKKPKRRTTPHASPERLRFEQESENEEYNFMPPTRPKRRSKRRKIPRPVPEIIPYTETILIDQIEKDIEFPVEEENIQKPHYYENNRMADKEQPDIHVTEPYSNLLQIHDLHDIHRRASEPIPAAPPRKHKSLKSLNASEHESIFDEYERDNENNNINRYANENIFMSSPSREDQIAAEHFDIVQEPLQPPKIPSRSRSKTRSMSRATSHAESILDRTDSILYDEENREPVVEEPCIKDLRDAMGYAIVDKSQNKNWEHPCCTVPRNRTKPPERPLRNYSTLAPSRPPRKLSRNMTDEEKENIDITQYIEIEDEKEERDLQSGEVIQKMQNRPLPAPPRPPRIKAKPLQDCTSRSNEQVDSENHVEVGQYIDESEVSTQTEPLPADFACEEVVQEESDKIMTPSALRKNDKPPENDQTNHIKIERVLITPTQYSYQEETITHGQLLVEPLNGAKILPDSELQRERIIPITSDEEENSEIPESFGQLSDPKLSKSTKATDEDEKPTKPPRFHSSGITENIDILKTQKLQVSDLDVDRLTVNELVANKIIVSDIESGNITSHEISSKSGTLKLADIELQPDVVKRLLDQLKGSSEHHRSILEGEKVDERPAISEEPKAEQKKTPIELHDLEILPVQNLISPAASTEEKSVLIENKESLQEVMQQPEENIISESTYIVEEPAQQPSSASEQELMPPRVESVTFEGDSIAPEGDVLVLEENISINEGMSIPPERILIVPEEIKKDLVPLETNSISPGNDLVVVEAISPEEGLMVPADGFISPEDVSTKDLIVAESIPYEGDVLTPEEVSMVGSHGLISLEEVSSKDLIAAESILSEGDLLTPEEVSMVAAHELLSLEEVSPRDLVVVESIPSEADFTALEKVSVVASPGFILPEEVSSSTKDIPIVSETNSTTITQIIPFTDHDAEYKKEASLLDIQPDDNEPPIRPPRSQEKRGSGCELKSENGTEYNDEESKQPKEILEEIEDNITGIDEVCPSSEVIEPEVDDEPPPRPPQPQVPYVPSQPPASFYALRAQHFVEGIPVDIPLIPNRRKRHQRPQTVSKSSSSESSAETPMPRRRVRSPEPSIPQLTGQLIGACSIVARNTIKRLIEEVNSNIASTTNTDADSYKQNVQVVIVILLVLIAGLLLLGYGDGRTVHLHHWEYFNPPTDL